MAETMFNAECLMGKDEEKGLWPGRKVAWELIKIFVASIKTAEKKEK